MATINPVGNGLSGTTGTGNFVGANTPTLITPVLGAATATTVTFSPTTGGIVGTTTNNDTNAGNIGEFITASNGSGTSLSNATPANITSISLTAGDWDVSGNMLFGLTGGATALLGGSSSTTATLPSVPFYSELSNSSGLLAAGGTNSLNAPITRYSLSGTTTVYLVGQANFASGSATGYGYLSARRIR